MAPHSLRYRVQQRQQKQQKQECQYDQHAKPCTYKQGGLVFVQDFCRQASSPWSPSTIVQLCSRQSYKVKLSNGQIVERHADHICKCTTSCDDVEQSEELEDVPPIPVSSKPVEQKASVQPTLHCSQRIQNHPIIFRTKGKACGNRLVIEL